MVSVAQQTRNVQRARDREALYVFIAKYKSATQGLTPTREEMATLLRREKGAYVMARLKELEEMGLIELTRNQRHILLKGGEWRLMPLVKVDDEMHVAYGDGATAARNIAAAYGASNE